MWNILKSLFMLRGADMGRRIVGGIAILISAFSYFYAGDSIPTEEITKFVDPIYIGGYGLVQLIIGILDRKKGR